MGYPERGIYLQAFHFRTPGGEKTGPIDHLFRGETFVWKPNKDGTGIERFQMGTISIDSKAKTITLTASIPDLKPGSIPYFFAYTGGPDSLIIDSLCQR